MKTKQMRLSDKIKAFCDVVLADPIDAEVAMIRIHDLAELLLELSEKMDAQPWVIKRAFGMKKLKE